MPRRLRRRLHVGRNLDPLVNSPSYLAPRLRLDRMRPEDLDAVMEIERLSFPEPWTPGLFLHELRIPFSTTLVVRDESAADQILGYVCWWLVGDEVHLLNVAVSPDRRRDGLGRALVQVVLDEARDRQARLVTLEVRHDNTAGLGLYRSLGFVERGLRKNYYGRGEHAVIMTCAFTNGSSAAGVAP